MRPGATMKHDATVRWAPRGAGAAGLALATWFLLTPGCGPTPPPVPADPTTPPPKAAPKETKAAPAKRGGGQKLEDEANYSSISERRRNKAKAANPGG